MFKQGLKHSAYVLVVSLLALGISLPLDDHNASDLIVMASVLISWLVVGYFFKKQNGSLLLLFFDSNKIRGMARYLLGVGIIWGPLKLLSAGFPIRDINPVINILLAMVSVPLAGMSVTGALIVGGMFYRAKA